MIHNAFDIRTIQPFGALDTLGQAQVLVHKGSHLYDPSITDMNAATAAERSNKDKNVASRNYQDELRKNCN